MIYRIFKRIVLRNEIDEPATTSQPRFSHSHPNRLSVEDLLIMHDRDPADNFIDANLSPPFQLDNPLFSFHH